MILVYSDKVTNRLKYAFELVFNDILKVELEITSDRKLFEYHHGPKLTYTSVPQKDKDSIVFGAADILFENEIRKQTLDYVNHDTYKGFFLVNHGVLNFDPFAASFYLVTRYEEYLPSVKDRHKRFKAESSLAFQRNFLQTPLVNKYANEVKKIVLEQYPSYEFPVQKYSFIPTFDIDQAYAYLNKGFLRQFLTTVGCLFKFRFKSFLFRLKVYSGLIRDPFDTYEKQFEIQHHYKLKPIYFFLVGNYFLNDNGLSYRNKKYAQLIRKIAENAQIGVHPSYAANFGFKKIDMEKKRIEGITKTSISISRNHYLRLSFPQTYRSLIKAGITSDYTMGYSSQIGFRASICTPFYFYDLEQEEKTNLKVHSFAAMDSTFKYYLKVRSTEVVYQLKPMIDEVKSLGGEFCVLFHNESLGGHKVWKNWGDVYEQVVKLALR